MPGLLGDSQGNPKLEVLIVGGGPVGLLTALRLGQAGIQTLVVESHHDVLPTTRAVVYMPVVNPVLTKLGIMDIVQQEAYLNRDGIVWRDIEGKELGHLPLSSPNQDEFGGVLLMGQHKLALLILKELEKYPCVEVRFGWKCGGIQDIEGSDTVKVLVHSPHANHSDTILEAKYVLGTDGANSSVRRMSCITFDGFTQADWKVIGADVIYDFIGEDGFTPLNFVVHPEHWAVIAFTGQDANGLPRGSGKPQWRVAYAESPDLSGSKDDYLSRANERIKIWTKGKENFTVMRAEPYIISQRCASQARKGRVMLAGDALHSNNPIGGLGLTGGILDAFCFGNALTKVLRRGESDQILTDCANSRRQVWLDTTNQLSQANLQRLHGFDPETAKQRAGFFNKLKTDDDFPKLVRAGLGKMIPETFE